MWKLNPKKGELITRPYKFQRAKPTVEPRPSKLLSAPFFYLWHLMEQSLPKPLPQGGSFWVRSYQLAPKFTKLFWKEPTDKYLQLWRLSRFCCKDTALLNCMKAARDHNEFKFHLISRVQSRSNESTVIKVGMLIWEMTKPQHREDFWSWGCSMSWYFYVLVRPV